MKKQNGIAALLGRVVVGALAEGDSETISNKDRAEAAQIVADMAETLLQVPKPVEDPTDLRILEWVKEDPDLTDQQIAQRLGIIRQAVNVRRTKLEAMGWKVR